MNRPELKDYLDRSCDEESICAYISDIGLYCTNLETQIKCQQNTIVKLTESVSKLENALCKACEMIADYLSSCPIDVINANMNKDCEHLCKDGIEIDCWREWFLKDE